MKVKLDFCHFSTIIALFTASCASEILESTPVTNWGTWGPMEHCIADDIYVEGFQLKTERYVGSGDDTSLNGINFLCGNPNVVLENNITSSVGPWGSWGEVFRCGFGRGFLSGFQLRVESYLADGDDTATNNIRVFCSGDLEDPTLFIEGDGENFGSWGVAKRCPTQHAICGLQTQIEGNQGDDDDTSLNNIRVDCCPILTGTGASTSSTTKTFKTA